MGLTKFYENSNTLLAIQNAKSLVIDIQVVLIEDDTMPTLVSTHQIESLVRPFEEKRHIVLTCNSLNSITMFSDMKPCLFLYQSG